MSISEKIMPELTHRELREAFGALRTREELIDELIKVTRERNDAQWAEQVVFDANRVLDELTFDNQDPSIGLAQRIRKAWASRCL